MYILRYIYDIYIRIYPCMYVKPIKLRVKLYIPCKTNLQPQRIHSFFHTGQQQPLPHHTQHQGLVVGEYTVVQTPLLPLSQVDIIRNSVIVNIFHLKNRFQLGTTTLWTKYKAVLSYIHRGQLDCVRVHQPLTGRATDRHPASTISTPH